MNDTHKEELRFLEKLSKNIDNYADTQDAMLISANYNIVLKIMDSMFDLWQEKIDINILKDYAYTELPKWLIYHIQTIDKAIARFFKYGIFSCFLVGNK